jgi:hypothetical protein
MKIGKHDRYPRPLTRVNILDGDLIEMLCESSMGTTADSVWMSVDEFKKVVAQIRRDGNAALQAALDTPPSETLSTAGYEAEEQARRREIHQNLATLGEKSQRVRVEVIGGVVYLFYCENAVIAQHMVEASRRPLESVGTRFTYMAEKRGRVQRASLPERKLGPHMPEEVRVQFDHKDTIRDVLAWLIAEGYGIDGEIPAVVDPRLPAAPNPAAQTAAILARIPDPPRPQDYRQPKASGSTLLPRMARPPHLQDNKK